jgi:hypothetical protein
MNVPLTDAPTNPRFESLLAAFASRMGLPAPREGLGLQLQADPLTVRVLADAALEDRLLVEVDIAPAQDAPAQALALLHRINHVARLRHGWQVSLDEDDHIVMHTQRSLTKTDTAALESLLEAALDRATDLHALWQKTLAALEAQNSLAAHQSLQSLGPSALRG